MRLHAVEKNIFPKSDGPFRREINMASITSLFGRFARKSSVPKREEERDEAFIRCPGCNMMLHDTLSRCPYCSAFLEVKCPQCDRSTSRRFDTCPYCSAILDKNRRY